MGRKIFTDETGAHLGALLRSAARLLGLHVCFHDHLNCSRLPVDLRTHIHPACEANKEWELSRCISFDWESVHKEIAASPAGRIHECPFGLTEMVAPVVVNGIFAGVLFAGPCWRKRGRLRPSHPALALVPDEDWLPDRLAILEALAVKVSAILEGRDRTFEGGRRAEILSFLNRNIASEIGLGELAKELCLSKSRSGHLVRELFGMSFPGLLRSLKMQRAAQMLVAGDLPVGIIATRLGFSDQNYFTRVFTRHHGESPGKYRKHHPLQA